MKPVGARGRSPVEWVLAVGVLDFTLEQAVVVPALPLVAHRYSASATDVVWLITAFGLTAAVATPLAGRLGDQYGRRRLMLWSLAAFTLGSVVCAVATSLPVLIGGRALEGLGTGTAPLALALVRDHIDPSRVSRSVGLLIGAAGSGSVLGELGGSWVIEHMSLAAMFWGMAGLSALGLIAVRLAMPESPVRASAPVDWLGAGLLGAALAALLLAISEGNDWGWGGLRVLGLFAGTCAGVAGFAIRQVRASSPLLDSRLLARRPVWSAQIVIFLIGFVAFSQLAVLPLLAGLPKSTGYGLGRSTNQIGVLLVPSSFAALASGPLAARLTARVGTRGLVVAGLLCIAAGDGILALFTVSSATILISDIPLGVSFGLTIGTTLDLVLANTGAEESGAALGLTNEIRAIASALGAAVAAAILVGAGDSAPQVPALAGFRAAFAAFAIASVAVIAFVPLLPGGAPVHRALEQA